MKKKLLRLQKNIFHKDCTESEETKKMEKRTAESIINTETSSIVYGDFRGEPNQELFRCPRELEDDLRYFVNKEKIIAGFEADNETTGLRNVKNARYCGYFRLYFSGRWCGKWMELDEKTDKKTRYGVAKIVKWLENQFEKGCDWEMKEYLKQFPVWGCKNRYLLKPLYSDCYKVMFDTTFGNGDYPVRIYVYEPPFHQSAKDLKNIHASEY